MKLEGREVGGNDAYEQLGTTFDKQLAKFDMQNPMKSNNMFDNGRGQT